MWSFYIFGYKYLQEIKVRYKNINHMDHIVVFFFYLKQHTFYILPVI